MDGWRKGIEDEGPHRISMDARKEGRKEGITEIIILYNNSIQGNERRIASIVLLLVCRPAIFFCLVQYSFVLSVSTILSTYR